MNQCLRLVDADMSEIASDGVVPAIWSFHCGVVVPIPTLPVVETNSDEVACMVVASKPMRE